MSNRMRTGTLSSIVVVLFAAAGCQPSGKPSEFTRDTGREKVELRESWRQYALDHYAGELLVELRMSADIRFIQPVAVTALREVKTGRIELIAIGELDETNLEGKRLRHRFYVAWKEAGGGWDLAERQILPGQTAPPPAKPYEAIPRTRPATTPIP